MCVGDEKGVLSKVELILPANVVEACYNLERNVHAYFMAVNQQDKTSSEITLYKLKDDSVKIRVTVLALGDDEDESAPSGPSPRGGGKRKRKPDAGGGGDDGEEPSGSKPKKGDGGKKGKGRGKGGVKEEDASEPVTPKKASTAPSSEGTPGRLRTAKGVDTPAATLEDFIPEEGDLVEDQSARPIQGEETLAVGPCEDDGPPVLEKSVITPSPPKKRAKASFLKGRRSMPAPQMVMEEEDDEEDSEEEIMYETPDPNTTASTVITVKKAIKSEEEKAADRVRKVQMGRPWDWGKKTTLVYERKEKTLSKRGEGGDVDASPKLTETLVINNRVKGMHMSADTLGAWMGAKRNHVIKAPKIIVSEAQGHNPDPDMPPIVLASEDGAIISADALTLNDASGGTVQVQVIQQDGDGTQVVEIAPTMKEQTIEVIKTPKNRGVSSKLYQTPMSAPPKVSMAKMEEDDEDIPCQICDTLVPDYEQLLKHVKANHMDVDGVDDYLEEVQMEMQVECPVCNVAVESQTALGTHIEKQHSHIGTEIRCEPCGKTYKSAASLKNHIRQQHTHRRRFECHVCSATFTETRSLREHINCVHETTETFDCDICGKTFLTKGRLRRHKYIHGGFRHYCEYCNKGFHLRDNMNKHVEIMHEQKFGKRFQCNYCGKAFTVKGNLQQHILGVHLKKALYECPICNEGFKRKSMMLDHMKSHARPKQEPGTSMVEALEPMAAAGSGEASGSGMIVTVSEAELAEKIKQAREANDGDTSGEEDYDYVEFD